MNRAPFARLAALTILIPALGACGDDGTGPDRLTASEVAGIYSVCTLTFSPVGALQPVDIRAAAFETTNQQVTQPRVTVDPSGTFELEYTPKGGFSDRELPGTFLPQVNTVDFTFTAAAAAVGEILLPVSFAAAFQEVPTILSVASSPEYTVPRADYARLRGISESGLAERIPGTLSARLARGSC